MVMQRMSGRTITVKNPFPAKYPGVCLLCDNDTRPGQMIGQANRYGWVHVTCAEQGYLPPSHTASCGAMTKAGHPCNLAVLPGTQCRYHKK